MRSFTLSLSHTMKCCSVFVCKFLITGKTFNLLPIRYADEECAVVSVPGYFTHVPYYRKSQSVKYNGSLWLFEQHQWSFRYTNCYTHIHVHTHKMAYIHTLTNLVLTIISCCCSPPWSLEHHIIIFNQCSLLQWCYGFQIFAIVLPLCVSLCVQASNRLSIGYRVDIQFFFRLQ